VLRESNRQFPIPFEISRLVRVLLSAMAVFFVSEALPRMSLPIAIAIRLVICLAFVPLLVVTGALSRAEVRGLPSLVRRVLARRTA
jgi:hypothetical protein